VTDRVIRPRGGGLLTHYHSVKWVWAALELVLGEPQPLKGIEVHEVGAAAPIHEGLGEPGSPDQRADDEGNLPGLGLLSRWSVQSKVIIDSDQCRNYRTPVPTELTAWPMSLSLRHDSWGAGLP
jgi:hypothetical protein